MTVWRPARRRLLGCLCASVGLGACAAEGEPVTAPNIAAGYRPEATSVEGSLWQRVEQAEARLRDSPRLVREPILVGYLEALVCRLGGAHCRDVRVYVVRAPAFNASMAPNGMMQVWTGLLLRVENEAQLAAVLGHEIGHYLRRHSIARFQRAMRTADLGAVLSLGIGVAALPITLAAAAAVSSYSRDDEREADAIGIALCRQNGLAPAEAAAVWNNLRAELSAGKADISRDPLFASHPSNAEREAALRAAAAVAPDEGDRGAARLRAALAPIRPMLLGDEVRLRQPERSVTVFARLAAAQGADGALLTAWGETLRLRGAAGDVDAAAELFGRAIATGDAPPEASRGLGQTLLSRGDRQGARAAFRTYLQRSPDAADAPLIRSLIEMPEV